MPRATEKTKPITIYPSRETAERIEEIAATERRSTSSQVLVWVDERLKEEPDGR